MTTPDAPTAPSGPLAAVPSDAIDAATRAADECTELCTDRFALCCIRAAVAAAAPLIAAAERRRNADGLRTLATRHRQQPGHNGDQTAGLDWAAHHLDPRQTEPGS